ncbi:MAG: hypothetical protein JWO03_1245 [Bacteroidetes bacterium]|nr:hypothetical protein [Bacteroidota bacterium]
MKTIYTLIFCSLFIAAHGQSDSIVYPIAPEDNTTDTLWGKKIEDPFRSLESNNVTRELWLEQEEKLTKSYFKTTKHGGSIADNFEWVSQSEFNIPRRSGPYYIENRIDPYSPNTVDIYYKNHLYGTSSLLVSPHIVSNQLSGFTEVAVSPSGNYIALLYSSTGSDWNEIGIYDIINQKLLNDRIKNVRYSSIKWRENGFYYSRFDSVDEKRKYLDVQSNQKLYYHLVATDPSNDPLIYQDKAEPLNVISANVTADERYLILTETNPVIDKTQIYIKDFTLSDPLTHIDVKSGFEFSVIGSAGDFIYVQTTYPDAYNGSIVEINTKNPSQWQIIATNQKDLRLRNSVYINNKIYALYQHEFQEYIVVYSDSGDILKKIQRPFGSSTRFISYSPEEKGIVLSKNYYFCPPIGELLSIKNDSISTISTTKVLFDPFKYQMTTATYYSADSTAIPIYIILNKDFKKKGPRPTLLEVYGGFGITPAPSFDPGLVLFLNTGGVFAFADVRGGGGSMKEWHQKGSLLNKINTFTDTYYAAKFLIKEGYADSTKLALTGASNGGLVCAVVANQHPGYFRAVIPIVGVYDMLRAEKFTAGAYHTKREFGTVKDSLQFLNLLSYSPLHNIRANTQYPAMLIMTSENDDRVPPLHAYKYVAALQKTTQSKNPILLNLEKGTGHSGSYSLEKRATHNKYLYAFLFKELDMKYHAVTSY